jgi:hypothetical protein
VKWPDEHGGFTDALISGLSALCLGRTFARAASKNHHGNAGYGQYTKMFAIRNGPSEWAAEYAVLKESGKLLGTLVANAIARMKNLESFFWDMPSGVLSRVFEALASLSHDPNNGCKLSRVWVRWHDNSQRPGEFGLLDPNDIVHGAAFFPQGS